MFDPGTVSMLQNDLDSGRQADPSAQMGDLSLKDPSYKRTLTIDVEQSGGESSHTASPSSRVYEYEQTNGQRSPQRREIVTNDYPIYGELEEDDEGSKYQRQVVQQERRGSSEPTSKKYMRKVQRELEQQRSEWGSEVEKMVQGSEKLQTLPVNSMTGGANSFVDTSSGEPVYKAFFDVSEFPPESINVSIDKLYNKCIVQADYGEGRMTKTFTQKVQLPRFADETRLTSKMSKKGILKVEVPLIYYFDPVRAETFDKKSKSFINEVKTNPKTGRQQLEILVNTDPDTKAKDLHVTVEGDNLVILADKMSKSTGKIKQKRIKQYTLPELADLDKIKSRLGRDGRLVITVPLRRRDRSISESESVPEDTQEIRQEVSRQQYQSQISPPDYEEVRSARKKSSRPTRSQRQETFPEDNLDGGGFVQQEYTTRQHKSHAPKSLPNTGLRTVKHEVTRQYHNSNEPYIPDPYILEQASYVDDPAMGSGGVSQYSRSTTYQSGGQSLPRSHVDPILYQAAPRKQYSSRVIYEEPESKVQIVKKTRRVRRT